MPVAKNELRAEKGSTRPLLVVRLQAEPPGGLLLEVQDNGPGLPEQPTPGRRTSFGQRLIRESTGQLGGEMSLTSQQGTYFRLWLPAQA